MGTSSDSITAETVHGAINLAKSILGTTTDKQTEETVYGIINRLNAFIDVTYKNDLNAQATENTKTFYHDGTRPMTGNINMGDSKDHKIVNLANPTNNNDAANKTYVDSTTNTKITDLHKTISGVDGTAPWKGKTLKEIVIEERGPLPWKWSVNIAIQIASALEAAHKNNIIHRDIKPHNIIITEDGVAKVTDFGIARFSNTETRTMTDKAIGSVHYIAPEQAKGDVTDGKSDIYSCGVMLYEMLTGQLPFQAENAVSVAIMQLQREPSLPTEINGSDVNEIITACAHDKKMSGDDITVVYVPEIGQFRFDKMSFSEYTEIIRQVFNK